MPFQPISIGHTLIYKGRLYTLQDTPDTPFIYDTPPKKKRMRSEGREGGGEVCTDGTSTNEDEDLSLLRGAFNPFYSDATCTLDQLGAHDHQVDGAKEHALAAGQKDMLDQQSISQRHAQWQQVQDRQANYHTSYPQGTFAYGWLNNPDASSIRHAALRELGSLAWSFTRSLFEANQQNTTTQEQDGEQDGEQDHALHAANTSANDTNHEGKCTHKNQHWSMITKVTCAKEYVVGVDAYLLACWAWDNLTVMPDNGLPSHISQSNDPQLVVEYLCTRMVACLYVAIQCKFQALRRDGLPAGLLEICSSVSRLQENIAAKHWTIDWDGVTCSIQLSDRHLNACSNAAWELLVREDRQARPLDFLKCIFGTKSCCRKLNYQEKELFERLTVMVPWSDLVFYHTDKDLALATVYLLDEDEFDALCQRFVPHKADIARIRGIAALMQNMHMHWEELTHVPLMGSRLFMG